MGIQPDFVADANSGGAVVGKPNGPTDAGTTNTYRTIARPHSPHFANPRRHRLCAACTADHCANCDDDARGFRLQLIRRLNYIGTTRAGPWPLTTRTRWPAESGTSAACA